MLRRDFVSKVIEQMANAIARLLELNLNEEPQKFLDEFDELLQTYFNLNEENLPLLLEENEERDALLLDEKLKNYQIRVLTNAGLVFVQTHQISKAIICIQIIERIQQKHAAVFEFPTAEITKLHQDLLELKKIISNSDF